MSDEKSSAAKKAQNIKPATTGLVSKKPVNQKPVNQKAFTHKKLKTEGAANPQKMALAPAKKPLGAKITQENKKPAINRRPQPKTFGQNKGKSGDVLRIIPLGGLGEVGKNITVYESGNDIIIVDCGLAFPNDEMLGVDIVLPDFDYVIKNKDRIRGLVITHGHEDHIGGIAYLLKSINIPVYATKFTAGLIEGKFKEHNISMKNLNVVDPKNTLKLGCFSVEYIFVNHSIPDTYSIAITTSTGTIIQTGDFKVDYTPIDGKVIDLARFGALGTNGVLALLSDSTNSEKAGSTGSESTVGVAFRRLFEQAKDKRIIIATFASNIYRAQQVVDIATSFGRKLAISGRSMVNGTTKALELGFLKDPENIIIDLERANSVPNEKLVVLTTGSQGEPMSALSRMASGEHRQLAATGDDFIIVSATPIPGNEKSVGRVVNALMELGAEVIYEREQNIHVSGHASQDEQKLMMALTKPKFFMPVHGEYKHLVKHRNTGISMGIPKENILCAENGDVIETDGNYFKIVDHVQSGSVMVDGLGVGDVGSVVLRDRKHLSEDGLIVVSVTINRKSGKIVTGPDVVSRGFVYVKESAPLMQDSKKMAVEVLEKCEKTGVKEWGEIRNRLRDELGYFIYKRTKRRPMILPVITQI